MKFATMRITLSLAVIRRVNSVRDALINAGVPSSKIRSGNFGNPQQQRDRRVEVLVSSR